MDLRRTVLPALLAAGVWLSPDAGGLTASEEPQDPSAPTGEVRSRDSTSVREADKQPTPDQPEVEERPQQQADTESPRPPQEIDEVKRAIVELFSREKAAHALSTAEIAALYGSAVVTIRRFDNQGRLMGGGSGIIFDQRGKTLYLLTNDHVIRGVHSLDALTKDEQIIEVSSIERRGGTIDLAVLRGSTKEELTLPQIVGGAGEHLVAGERVVAIGSPLGLKHTVSDGVVSAIRRHEGVTYIQTTAPISSGSSGGPLFNSLGELVGLTTASIPEGQNINLAVAIDHLVDLLDSKSTTLSPAPEHRDEASGAPRPIDSGISFLVEAGLLFAGIFLTIWWFSVMILPIVHGFPRAFYWVARGWAKWRAPFYYLLTPVIWTIVLVATAIVLAIYLPGISQYLRHSSGFGAGQFVGLFTAIGRALFSKSARLALHHDFLSFMIPHLTPAGVSALEEAALVDQGSS